MTSLIERYTVPVPYVRAKEYLASMLSDAAGKQTQEPLRLVAPLEDLGGRQLEKTVLVRYAPASDPMHFDQPWHVSWTPEQGGPYPDFDGQITVRADEDYDSSILELAGSYTPPLGAAGRAFDAAIGRRIASGTAQRLLAGIASQMEARFQNEEAAKH